MNFEDNYIKRTIYSQYASKVKLIDATSPFSVS